MASRKVLLTGGSGFIASHVLDLLLEQGFDVVVTARSDSKGRRILDSIDSSVRMNLSYVVVEDIAREGAFDQAVQSEPPFDYVVHTASPYHSNIRDPVKDMLDPAIKGTTGLLRAVKAHAPCVRRVVITSSSAAILSPPEHAAVYDESTWADVTWDQAMDPQHTYRASKKFSEQAAWAFVADERPGFDLATINNTYTFGPVPRSLRSLTAINTSNHRIRDLIQGRMREALEPTAPVFTFVDVRDVARAHVRALTEPSAGGNRFYLVAGHFSNKRIADIIRRARPEFSDRLPPPDVADDFPEHVYAFDNTKSRSLLGIEYIGLETSVRDTVESLESLVAPAL